MIQWRRRPTDKDDGDADDDDDDDDDATSMGKRKNYVRVTKVHYHFHCHNNNKNTFTTTATTQRKIITTKHKMTKKRLDFFSQILKKKCQQIKSGAHTTKPAGRHSIDIIVTEIIDGKTNGRTPAPAAIFWLKQNARKSSANNVDFAGRKPPLALLLPFND